MRKIIIIILACLCTASLAFSGFLLVKNNQKTSSKKNTTEKKTTRITTSSKTTTKATTKAVKKVSINAYLSDNNAGYVRGSGVFNEGESAIVSVTLQDGYTFDGWYLGSEKVSSATSYHFIVTKDMELMAKVSSDTPSDSFIVSFNSDGGSDVKNQNVISGMNAVEPKTPTKEGCTFLYWTLDDLEYDFSSEVTSNIDLKAVWSEDSYTLTIAPNIVNAATITGIGSYKYGDVASITIDLNSGYNFVGMKENGEYIFSDLEKEITITNNTYLEAIFSLIDNATYTVNHYLEELDGTYSLDDTEEKSGVPGSLTNAVANEYVGFKVSQLNQQTISSSNDTVIDIIYDRIPYNLKITSNINNAATITGEGSYKYGESATITIDLNEGFNFNGIKENGVIVITDLEKTITIDKDIDYEAVFSLKDDIEYTIIHKLEALDGSYEEDLTETGYGTFNTLTNATPKTYTGFKVTNFNQELIKVDGTTTVIIKYDRVTYSLNVTLNITGAGTISGDGSYKYGDAATLNISANPGYKFDGMKENNIIIFTDLEKEVTVNKDINYEAIFSLRDDIEYTVIHKLEALDGTYEDELTETKYGIAGTLTNAQTKTYTGYSALNYNQDYIKADGTTSIIIKYDRIPCNLGITTNITDAGIITGSGTYKYGETVTITISINTGYKYINATENDNELSTENSFTITIFENRTINVVFEENPVDYIDYNTYGENIIIDEVTNKDITDFIIPEEIDGNQVTTIDDRAFSGCDNLEDIVIPSSIERISIFAFEECSSLKNVYYDGTIYDWCKIRFGNELANPMYYADNFYILDEFGDVSYKGKNYSKLVELIIPESITEIYKYAFYNFNTITSLTLIGNVTKIGYKAFSGCTNMNDLYYNYSFAEWNAIEFVYGDDLEFALEANPMHYVNNFYQLVDIYTNGTLNHMGISYESIVAVTHNMVEYALVEALYLEASSINEYQFYNFRNVKQIGVYNQDSLLPIGKNAFKNCGLVEKMLIPSITNNDYQLTFGMLFGDETYANSYAVNQYTIPVYYPDMETKTYYLPKNLEFIRVAGGDVSMYSFMNMTSLKKVVLSVQVIGEGAFLNCTYLQEVIITGQLMVISNNAFENCGMKYIMLPITLQTIGRNAFKDCKYLESVYYEGNGDNWFNVTLYVEEGYDPINKIYYYETTPMYYASNFYILDAGGDVVLDNGYVFENSYYQSQMFSQLIEYRNNYNTNNMSVRTCQFYGFDHLRVFELSGGYDFSIGYAAFAKCYSLEILSIPCLDNLRFGSIFGEEEYVGSYAAETIIDNGYGYDEKIYYIPRSLETIYIGGGYIDSYAFMNMKYIKKVALAVSSIGSWAFLNCTYLQEVIISANLKTINNNAFENCGMRYIMLPITLERIGRDAFKDCKYLESVYYEGDGNSWSSIDLSEARFQYESEIYYFETTPMYYASNFYILDEYGDVELRNGFVFGDNYGQYPQRFSQLRELTVFNSYVSDCQFYGFDHLEKVNITYHNSYDEFYIGYASFGKCYSLKELVIPSLNNMTFGQLFGEEEYIGSYAASQYIIYNSPEDNILKTYYIPRTLSLVVINGGSVKEYAFMNTRYLQNVIVRSEIISKFAFLNCEMLEVVVIGVNVTTIEDAAFANCNRIEYVCYEGSYDDSSVSFSNITIGVDNDSLTNATLYLYSEENPEIAGDYWHYVENGFVEIWS